MQETTLMKPQVKGQEQAEQQTTVRNNNTSSQQSEMNSVALEDGLSADPLSEDPLAKEVEASTENNTEVEHGDEEESEPELNKRGLYKTPGKVVRKRAASDLALEADYPCLNYDPAKDAEEQALVERLNHLFDEINANRIQWMLDYYEESLLPRADLGTEVGMDVPAGTEATSGPGGVDNFAWYDKEYMREKLGRPAYKGDFQNTGETLGYVPSGEISLHSYDESVASGTLWESQQKNGDLDLNALPVKEYARIEDEVGLPLYIPQYGFPTRKPRVYTKDIYRGHIYVKQEEAGVQKFARPSRQVNTTKKSLGDRLLRGGGKRLKGKKSGRTLGYARVEAFWIEDSGPYRLPEYESKMQKQHSRNQRAFAKLQDYYDRRAEFIKNFQPFLDNLD